MVTAVVENLDFTNVDRFEICPNDENTNANDTDRVEATLNKEESFVFEMNDGSTRQCGGRFKQIVHAYLGFGGGTHTNLPRSATLAEEARDYVVCI